MPPAPTSLSAELPEIAAILAEHLPYSPLDYIPGISRKGDRAIAAEQLTRPLVAADDLRFRATLPDGAPLAIFGERLPWDSEFFGYGVARLNGVFRLAAPWLCATDDYRPALESWLRLCRESGLRYVFAQVDPRDLPLTRALGELGFALIETRYFHHGAVQAPTEFERLPVREAVPEDIPSLSAAASSTINPYDRFHADPFIDPTAAAQLMERWVAESVHKRMADLTIVPDELRPAALVTYRLHRAHWARWKVNLVQGVFSAVAPDCMGWMGKLGPEMQWRLSQLGATYSFGSTQVTNRAILWFAQESGARFGRCEYVFRLIL